MPSAAKSDCHTNDDYSSGDYLFFASNGMTDNEKIDDGSYFDTFLTETTDDDSVSN